MTSTLLAAVLLVCAAAATQDLGEAAAEVPDSSSEDADVEDDGEADYAPFMIVLEHLDGWRCAGSLVSLRTALTSAWCARGRGAGPARELWALAASAAALSPNGEAAVAARLHGARRVARLAVATGADAEVGDGSEPSPRSWRGGAMDLALVELEEPFGGAARARPILMATAAGECAGGAQARCHVSRAEWPPRRTSLSVVTAGLAPPETCARAADYWNAVRDRVLCLVGPELCASDWGGGVVCGGKLCGVLSRSVRGGGVAGAGGGNSVASDECGDTHAAQSVSLWRRFLHCAHTLRACGRGGDCADLCVERQLVEDAAPPAPASLEPPASAAAQPTTAKSPTTPAVFLAYPTRSSAPRGTQQARAAPTRSRAAAPAPAPAPAPRATFAPVFARGYTPAHAPAPAPAAAPAPLADHAAAADAPASPRPSFEFEPNRADFKAAAPSRTTRAYLKAGEYGDNAAEYGGEEAPAPVAPAPAAPAPAPTRTAAPAPPSASPAAKPPPAERRSAPAPAGAARADRLHPLAILILVPFVYIYMTI